jgi:hypothetical protein
VPLLRGVGGVELRLVTPRCLVRRDSAVSPVCAVRCFAFVDDVCTAVRIALLRPFPCARRTRCTTPRDGDASSPLQ